MPQKLVNYGHCTNQSDLHSLYVNYMYSLYM